MGGIFGVTSKSNCVYDLFFGTDYHSHLGTHRGGMTVLEDGKFQRAIHNIQNSPFRTKFERDVEEMKGNYGIGCISDTAPQPLTFRSHLGTFALTTVGRINNMQHVIDHCFATGMAQFSEMGNGLLNPTELVAALIGSQQSIPEGIKYAQDIIEGSMTMMVLTEEGIYAVRDRLGRTPLVIGSKEDAFCAASENFAFFNLGYEPYKELGPAEIMLLTPDGAEQIRPAQEEMKMCAFMWSYYGYPTTSYEGVSVEQMRYRSGSMLAKRETSIHPDLVAGVPDSGTPYAIGYANTSEAPFARPFIKYTPTWPRSFMPPTDHMRDLIARMKLIPVEGLIRDKKLLMVDDSIVTGTQMKETTEFLYTAGAREVHVRSACPPILFGCPYLNFTRFTPDSALISRKVIHELEGDLPHDELLEYANPDSDRYAEMLEKLRVFQDFTTLQYHRVDDLQKSIGLEADKLCTYCWDGRG